MTHRSRTATLYGGIMHDFVMLHPLAGTHAAKAATAQGAAFLREALHGSSEPPPRLGRVARVRAWRAFWAATSWRRRL